MRYLFLFYPTLSYLILLSNIMHYHVIRYG
nr:MAG TPA: hypothetical protein [Caudoviricetes sp.]